MERARQTLNWNQRSEMTKTVFVIAIIVGATLGGFGLFTIAMGTPTPLVVVESDSMIPTLYRGHLLVLQAQPPEDIIVGDIIVFHATYHDKPIVHRVIEVQNVSGVLHYITKGDNNEIADMGFRVFEDIIGVVVLAIPYIGNVTLFLHEPLGFAVVVILFLALLILPEIFMKNKDEEEVEKPQENDEQETPNA